MFCYVCTILDALPRAFDPGAVQHGSRSLFRIMQRYVKGRILQFAYLLFKGNPEKGGSNYADVCGDG